MAKISSLLQSCLQLIYTGAKCTQTFLSLPVEKRLSPLCYPASSFMSGLKHLTYYIIMWYSELWNCTVLSLNPNSALMVWTWTNCTLDFISLPWKVHVWIKWANVYEMHKACTQYLVHCMSAVVFICLSPPFNMSSLRERALSYTSWFPWHLGERLAY